MMGYAQVPYGVGTASCEVRTSIRFDGTVRYYIVESGYFSATSGWGNHNGGCDIEYQPLFQPVREEMEPPFYSPYRVSKAGLRPLTPALPSPPRLTERRSHPRWRAGRWRSLT